MRHKRSNTLANITELNDQYQLQLAVPGFDKDDLSIKIEKNILHISGQTEVRDERYTYREYHITPVERSFRLPKTVDTTNIEAQLVNGVLTVNLSKIPEAKPRKIVIA